MRPALTLVAVASLLSLTSASLIAKNGTIGIYAIIDEVTFAPDGSSPNLIRMSGVFVVPVPMSSGMYKDPQSGYLYFRIPSGMEETTRREWNQLKTTVGTGQVVGFAQYWVPNPADPNGNPHRSLEVIVHRNNDEAPPDIYPLANPKGIVKRGDKYDPDFDKIAARLRSLNAGHYRSRRPSMAFSMVTSSAYSRSAPTGMPTPMRVTRTPSGFSNLDM